MKKGLLIFGIVALAGGAGLLIYSSNSKTRKLEAIKNVTLYGGDSPETKKIVTSLLPTLSSTEIDVFYDVLVKKYKTQQNLLIFNNALSRVGISPS